MNLETILSTLEMAGMAVISVGLWTLRVALTARGRKVAGSITAGAEAIVFLMAFSTVLTNMEAIERVFGYALGVAAGTLLGVFADERLSAGQSEVRIVVEGNDLELARQLHDLGWPATSMGGLGPMGDVTVTFVAVDDKRLPRMLKVVERLAPDGFWTVERLKTARAVVRHEGWVQVGGGGWGRRHRTARRELVLER